MHILILKIVRLANLLSDLVICDIYFDIENTI